MKFVSFTRLLVKNFQYQVYPFQFVKVYLKRYFYTIPQNKILAHINWKYELKLSILKPKKTGTTVNSSTELVICSLERSYYKRFNLSSTLNYMNHLEWDLSIFALVRKILMYKTILFVYISILFILWFLACFNYKLIELCILFCYWE